MYSSYIYKILKQVHPHTGILNRAIKCIHLTFTSSSSRFTLILVSETGQSKVVILHLKGPQAGPSWYWYLKQTHQIYSFYIHRILMQVHPDTGILTRAIKYAHPTFTRSPSRSIPILGSQPEPSDILIPHLQGLHAAPPWYWYLELGTQMCSSCIHGLPWGSSGQPVPIPVKTCPHTQRYGSQVGYNPWVSKSTWDRNAGSHYK